MIATKDGLLTIGEAAHILGRSVDALRRWEREDRLIPAGRGPRGERLYRHEQLEAISGRPPARLPVVQRQEAIESCAPSDDPGAGTKLQALWYRVRRYVLKVTTEPVPDNTPPESMFFDPERRYRYVWVPDASDRCAELCERRARRYLFPSVTFADLASVVNRTVEQFVRQEIDRRIREELLRDGIDPDED